MTVLQPDDIPAAPPPPPRLEASPPIPLPERPRRRRDLLLRAAILALVLGAELAWLAAIVLVVVRLAR